MDLTSDEFDDLVGAYALDACEPDEVEAMDRYIASDRAAATEVERLREVASGIGAAGAARPPVALLERLLHSAAERVSPLPADEALQRETDRFDAFLDSLADADLEAPTENGLTVRELVQHVEAVDRAFLAAADDPTVAYIGPDDVATITEADLPTRVDEPFAETVARFRRTRALLGGLRERLPADQRVAGYGRDHVLLVRVFETWTHHDDARRALGQEIELPDPEVMRTMAGLAMRSLPLALAVRGTTRPGHTARLVLEGPGGGEWSVPCAPGEMPSSHPDVVVRASVVEWCRRFADRMDADAVTVSVDGDTDLAQDLVQAANAFAGL
jgi:uncharacterized protein (TIGR03083 family)